MVRKTDKGDDRKMNLDNVELYAFWKSVVKTVLVGIIVLVLIYVARDLYMQSLAMHNGYQWTQVSPGKELGWGARQFPEYGWVKVEKCPKCGASLLALPTAEDEVKK